MNKNLLKIKIVGILFFISLLSACTNPFGDGDSSVDTNYGPKPTNTAPTNFEVVSGSNQGGTTALNRKAEVTVGSPVSKLKLKTSLNRTMYATVQGQIISK